MRCLTTVDVVEHMGSEFYVHLRVGDERLVARVQDAPAEGEHVSIDLGTPLRFDPESGARMRA